MIQQMNLINYGLKFNCPKINNCLCKYKKEVIPFPEFRKGQTFFKSGKIKHTEEYKKMVETKNKALKVGEKYLSIQILGKNGINTAVFPNKNKDSDNHPDYVGNGIAVWVKKKTEGKEENKEA